MPHMIEWTVKIKISDVWVADGYEATAEGVKEALLGYSLGYAYDHEVEVELVKSPPPEVILDIQTLGPYDERGTEED